MYGFKGLNSERSDYDRVSYKKWPWVSFLVATICVGTIFFIAGSPTNLYQMSGGILILCSIFLTLGCILLLPSSVVVIYLVFYYIIVYFNCSCKECYAKPLKWATERNTITEEDPLFAKPARHVDENENSTRTRNKRKNEQTSGSRAHQPELLSVPAIMKHANHTRSLPVGDVRQPQRMRNKPSVYSVQTDDSYHPEHFQTYSHIDQNQYSRDNRYINKGYVSDGEFTDEDSISIQFNEDEGSDKTYSYMRNIPDEYNHSSRQSVHSRHSLYGVSRAPNLGDSFNYPPTKKPPVEAQVVIEHRVTPPTRSRTRTRDDMPQSQRHLAQKQYPTDHSIELREYGSSHKHKTLAQYAKEAPQYLPHQVLGYQKTRSLAGYHETSLSSNRPSSRYDNSSLHNNNHQSKRSIIT